MTEQDATLNNEVDSSTTETLNAGESSTPMESADGLISTTEFEVHKPEVQADEPAKDEADSASDKEEHEPGESDKGPIPYQRFKEKVDQINDLQAKFSDYEKKVAMLEGQLMASQKTEPKNAVQTGSEQSQFVNMAGKSNEELTDWFDQNPLGFIANLAAQIQHETRQVVLQELDHKNRSSTYESKIQEFGEKNEGFNEMLRSGKLNQYAKANPGYDVFSAYYELTSDNRQTQIQKQIEEAVEKAKSELKKEYEKNIKAKRELRPIGPGPSAVPSGDKELENTSSLGGLTTVLAQRLTRMRKAG